MSEPGPQPARVALTSAQVSACGALADTIVARAASQTRALDRQLREARAPLWPRMATLDRPRQAHLWVIASGAVPLLAQLAATIWTMTGGETSGLTHALERLAAFRLFHFQPFGIADDLWSSWSKGQVGMTGEGEAPLWWVNPAAAHVAAAVIGVLAMVALAALARYVALDRKPRALRAAAYLLLAAWTVLSLQIAAAWLLLVGLVALVVGFVGGSGWFGVTM